MVVRRVWGKVVVNTVKVDVYTHFLTDKQICVSKCLPLENDEIHVRFQLTGGRRTESLREQQVADTAVTHLAIQQQVLAQQIAAAIDPTTLAAAYALRGSVGANGGSEAAVPFPWMLQGARGVPAGHHSADRGNEDGCRGGDFGRPAVRQGVRDPIVFGHRQGDYLQHFLGGDSPLPLVAPDQGARVGPALAALVAARRAPAAALAGTASKAVSAASD